MPRRIWTALGERTRTRRSRLSIRCLLTRRRLRTRPEKRREIEEIKTLLFGVLDARDRALLSMNVPTAALEKIVSALPVMKKPTVSLTPPLRRLSQTVCAEEYGQQPYPEAEGLRGRRYPRNPHRKDCAVIAIFVFHIVIKPVCMPEERATSRYPFWTFSSMAVSE